MQMKVWSIRTEPTLLAAGQSVSGRGQGLPASQWQVRGRGLGNKPANGREGDRAPPPACSVKSVCEMHCAEPTGASSTYLQPSACQPSSAKMHQGPTATTERTLTTFIIPSTGDVTQSVCPALTTYCYLAACVIGKYYRPKIMSPHHVFKCELGCYF